MNNRFGWWLYMTLARYESRWRMRHGYDDHGTFVTVDEGDLLRDEYHEPVRHPVVSVVHTFMFWCGFIPF